MKSIYALVPVLLFQLSGCAIMAVPYEAPVGVSTVDFTVENRLRQGMFVHAYGDAKECQGRRLISFLEPAHTKTVGIQSEKEFAFSLTVLVPDSKFCTRTVSFVPENGYKYFSAMEYRQENNLCSLVLTKTNREGVTQHVEAFHVREPGGLVVDESGSFCKKKD